MENKNGMTANDIIKLGASAIGATAIIFFGWKTYQYFKNKSANINETKDLRKEIDANNVTLSDSQAQSIADNIQTALNTNFWDDSAAVERELKKLKNIDDWRLVIIKFGKRKRDTFASKVDGGLEEWLTDALSMTETYRANNILSKIGVTL